MPHDRDGNLVQVGDRVLIEASVESITSSEDYPNLTVRTVCPMPPYTEGTILVLNAKQVRLSVRAAPTPITPSE